MLAITGTLASESCERLYRTRSSGQGTALAAARSFRYEDEPVASVFRVVNDDGNPILQVRRNANYIEGQGCLAVLPVDGRGDDAVAVDLSPALRARAGARLVLRPDEEDPWRTMCTNRREMCGLNSAAWEWRGSGTTSSILVTLTAQPTSQEGPNDLLSTTAIR